MENRHLIEPLAPPLEWRLFLHGAEPSERGTAASIVWALEHAAVQAGWPEGAYVGSELELRARFKSSRAAVRQAIRIVEAHSSMSMKRGREGGLYLTRASTEATAAALAAYLCASGCSVDELTDTTMIADKLFAELPADSILPRLHAHTVRLFEKGAVGPIASDARGALIAMRLLHGHPVIPERGARLGSEAELCERFHCARATLRQALRVLDDLGMLRVRRGRGGGYVLERPSPIGMIRRVFTLFASRQLTLQDIVPMTWALNVLHLRLAAHELQRMAASARAEQCARMSAMLEGAPEPRRWTLLQQQLEHLAQSKLAGTLLRCCVAYQVRLGRPAIEWSALDPSLLELERRVVQSLCAADVRGAELAQRLAQRRVSQLLGCPDLPCAPTASTGELPVSRH